MEDKVQKQSSAIADELRGLLDGDPPEEVVHQFFADRIFRLGHGNPRGSERFVAGTVSKFPITPARIPDFCSVVLNVQTSQTPSRVSKTVDGTEGSRLAHFSRPRGRTD